MNDDHLTNDETTELADAMLVLAEMAEERGLDRLAELGNLPPLDPETKAKYLARAKRRAEEAERHAS